VAFKSFVEKRVPRLWQADAHQALTDLQAKLGFSPVDAGQLIKQLVRRVTKEKHLRDPQDQKIVFSALIEMWVDPHGTGEIMPADYGYKHMFRKIRRGKLRIHYHVVDHKPIILWMGYRKDAYTKAAARSRK
jgi:mRNA-degrading endonuclease RelE of RelBE toxin-antitoxin system